MKYEYADDIWIHVKLSGNGGRQYIGVSYSLKLTQKIAKLEKEALELHKQKADTANVSLAYASKERLRNYDNFKNSVNQIFDDDRERIIFRLDAVCLHYWLITDRYWKMKTWI